MSTLSSAGHPDDGFTRRPAGRRPSVVLCFRRSAIPESCFKVGLSVILAHFRGEMDALIRPVRASRGGRGERRSTPPHQHRGGRALWWLVWPGYFTPSPLLAPFPGGLSASPIQPMRWFRAGRKLSFDGSSKAFLNSRSRFARKRCNSSWGTPTFSLRAHANARSTCESISEIDAGSRATQR